MVIIETLADQINRPRSSAVKSQGAGSVAGDFGSGLELRGAALAFIKQTQVLDSNRRLGARADRRRKSCSSNRPGEENTPLMKPIQAPPTTSGVKTARRASKFCT